MRTKVRPIDLKKLSKTTFEIIPDFKRKNTGWKWEAEMGPAPRRGDVTKDAIYNQVLFDVPKTSREIHDDLVTDFAELTQRNVIRHLGRLLEEGKIKVKTYPNKYNNNNYRKYTRTGRRPNVDNPSDQA